MACASVLGAQADVALQVNPKDEGATAVKVGLTTSSVIRFSESGVEVDDGNGATQTFDFATIASLTFVEGSSSAIDAATVGSLQISLAENPVTDRLIITGYDSEAPANLQIVSSAGRTVALLPAWKGEIIDASSWTPGLYILRLNTTTIKFIKR